MTDHPKTTGLRRALTGAALATLMLPAAAMAEENYVRLEMGLALPDAGDANWLPPGYPQDPQVNFNLGDMGSTGFGSIAVGHAWDNGFRADLAFLFSGKVDATGPCSSASDASDCNTHADITGGEVSTAALMANLTYAFMPDRQWQPFVTAGLGVARNKMSDWTRTANPGNTNASRPVRTFEGATEQGFAWTVGAGASRKMMASGRPMYLDLTWRYFDFGEAKGGTTALDGDSAATEALNFDMTGHLFSVGLRIPF